MKRYGGQQREYQKRDYGPYYGPSSQGTQSSRYKKPRLPPAKPPKRTSFDFKISKVIVGDIVADAADGKPTGEPNEMRLQFFLKHDSNSENRPDSISLFANSGASWIVIEAVHIRSIKLSQKNGVFWISTDGDFQTGTTESEKTVSGEVIGNPLFTRLIEHKDLECHVDMNHPVTQPKHTKENIQEWSKEGSPFRSVLDVVDEDQPKSLDEIFASWAKQSSIGLHSDRLLFAKLQLPKVDRLLDIVTRLVRKETSLGPAVEALAALVKTMAERAGMEREELERMVVPVVQLVPEHLVFRALDGMWRAEGAES